MSRTVGSKNKPKSNGETALRNTVDGDELLRLIASIEARNYEQQQIAADRAQIFKDLKAAGYNGDTVRAIIRRRKLTADERDTADALMDQYMSALGEYADTPLGQAGADRMREEAHAG